MSHIVAKILDIMNFQPLTVLMGQCVVNHFDPNLIALSERLFQHLATEGNIVHEKTLN